MPVRVTHACNPSFWEAVGLGIKGHPQLPIEFEASMSYVRSCLKTVTKIFQKQYTWAWGERAQQVKVLASKHSDLNSNHLHP